MILDRKELYRKRLSLIPQDLASMLSFSPEARFRFGTLSSEQKGKLTSYLDNSPDVWSREERCEEIVSSLKDDEKMWFND